MDDLDWNDLRVFLAAREAGSFSAAAGALGVRQSTVSRRIAALEASLGGALFHRTAAGLVQTALGESVAALAEAMRDAARSVGQIASAGAHTSATGLVRLAVAEGLSAYGLVPRLAALRSAHPGLRLDIVASAETADLLRRDADLALRFVRPAGDDLVARRLADFPLGVLVHRALADVPWEALPWVAFSTPGVRTPLDAWQAEHASRPVVRSNSYATVVAAVEHGLGAALLTAGLAPVLRDVVVRPAPVELPPPLPLWLVAHHDVRRLQRVDVVWRALVAMVEGMAPAVATGPRGP